MKRVHLLFIALFAFASFTFAQETKYQLSSHILDITLSKKDKKDNWKVVEEKYTDTNGRITDFLKQDGSKTNVGIYKLTFYTSEYFKKLDTKTFYPFIEVVFELTDNEHYHVPITLSTFGYSTYRGN